MLAWCWDNKGWAESLRNFFGELNFSRPFFPLQKFFDVCFQLAGLSLGPHPGKFYQIHWVISCTYFRKLEIAGWDRRAPLGQIHPNTWLIKSLPLLPAFLAKQQQVYGGRGPESLREKERLKGTSENSVSAEDTEHADKLRGSRQLARGN